MSELLNRSRSNKTAAGLLIASKEYAPSIHCSYYSFLQTAQHIVLVTQDKTMIDLIREQTVGKNRPTSHVAIKNALVSLIRRKDRLGMPQFVKEFEILKQQRQSSDYGLEIITEDDAVNAQRKSDDLKSKLLKWK